jgi:hypothetical protein
MTHAQLRCATSLSVRMDCSNWNACERRLTATAPIGQMRLVWGLGLLELRFRPYG